MKPLLLPLPGYESLAASLAARIDCPLAGAEIKRLPDGETYVRLSTTPHPSQREVILVGSLRQPNVQLLPLVFLAGAARDMGARRVGLVAPYLAYLRQDRRRFEGEALTSAYFAQLLSGAVDWLITVEPHVRGSALTSIYSVRTEVLQATEAIAAWVKGIPNPVIIGPDAGSEALVSRIAQAIQAPFHVMSKVRKNEREVEVRGGDLAALKGRHAVVVDDMISTGKTMLEVIHVLHSQGFTSVSCAAVHGIFAEGALDALKGAGTDRIATANTIPHPTNAIDVTPLIARALLGMIEG